ncbi:GumC family protein [Duncaniella muris]|uniref:GumC family protein n=1 Tax=Duncaniella muris TaxID=2094150 RepID=UPI00136AE7BF|nr:polysaccharide biosynthesis tyrosine autokinase [Duncaniella muris]NBH91952.1 polysaccharide biosynthesis tyrosine autokinase [Muribaculaceae bacterium S4]NBI19922.1 polysaccharide biosynthesis tyrosine autokinase [Muribaculaceae bacterium Z1]
MQRNLNQSPATGTETAAQAASFRQNAEGFAKIKDIIFLMLGHWKWFVLSLAVAFGAAYYYLQITPKVYTASAAILVKSDEKNSGSEDVLLDLGIKAQKVNITNEIMSMLTGSVADEITRRLQLNTEYYHPGTFHKTVAYGVELPVTVELPDLGQAESASFSLQLRKDSTIRISSMVLNDKALDGSLTFSMGKPVKTPLGIMTVKPSPYYREGFQDELTISRIPFSTASAQIRSSVDARQRNNRASIIDITYSDQSRTRAEDILSTLVAVYNENWIKDRNQVTASTTEFIKERLSIIESELGNVDSDISNYKSRNLVTDVSAMGGIALSQMNSSQEAGRELDNRVYMTKYLRNYLTDGMHEKEQLPANSGIDNPSIEAQIQAYNQLLLQRNNHLSISSEQNPLVMDIDQKLSTMKGSILGSLDNELTMLSTQKRAISSAQSQAVSKIAANPQQAKYLLSVERQQKVKESLYLFLLQKREENELSQAFTAYNTRLIEHPTASPVPVTPIPSRIMTFALIAGLFVPAGIIMLIESFNTAVRGRKDLQDLHAPFVGEIPLATQRKGKRRVAREVSDNRVVVKSGSRSIMNEAFRVVRTNLEFILGFDGGHHVVMLSSMNPGSGKTFTCANLSTALAIKGKKVIAVDLDLRRASLSAYVDNPAQGVSNYLSGQVADYHDVIVRLGELDVLPVGTIPPNPTELFFHPRFARMMEELKENYDYVILDCPPVEIVADAAIISRYAEMTLFIIRAHLMDRSFLADIENWYQERRYPNISVILNGTRSEFSHYGGSRYGYQRYGYHYGHYGEYTDSAEESEKRS